MTCENCNQVNQNLKIEINGLPAILIIHLKRFLYSDGFLRKIEELVKFTE